LFWNSVHPETDEWISVCALSKQKEFMKPEAEFMNVQFSRGFWAYSWEFSWRVEVSVYNVYITDQLQTTFAQEGGGGRGVKSISRGDRE
jgi:hypothetical protein